MSIPQSNTNQYHYVQLPDSQAHSPDAIMWRAQYDGIKWLLLRDENRKMLESGQSVTFDYCVCPYDSSLEHEFKAYYLIFHKKFQVWANDQWFTYTQKTIENWIVQMTFALKKENNWNV